MASLSRKITDWVGAELITAEQGEKLRRFEQNRKSVLTPFLALGLVGMFAVGLGIIAVIAANWRNTPVFVKLTAMFAMLIGNACAAVRFQNKKPALFEALLFLQGILFFAAMGLVGQIWHLQSELWQTLTFWSVLAFPLILLTKKEFFGFLWEIAALTAVLDSPLLREILYDFLKHFDSSMCFSAFFMTVWGVTLLTDRAKVFVIPLRWISAVLAVLFLLLPDYIWEKSTEPFVFVVMAVWAAVSAGVLYRLKTPYKSLYAVCVVFATVLSGADARIVVFAAQICVLMSLIVAAAQANAVGLSRVLSLCLGGRLFTLYLEVFGSLLLTGFGLIVTGMVILGLAYGWHKLDSKLKAGLK